MNASESRFSLNEHYFERQEVCRSLSPSSLYEHAIRFDDGASVADNGALVAYSGTKTGRSPKDKRVVSHPDSSQDVWWGPVNIPLRCADVRRTPKAGDRLSQQLRTPVLL